MEMLIALFMMFLALAVLAFPLWVIVKVRRIAQLEGEVQRLEARIDTLGDTIVVLQTEAADRSSESAKEAIRTTPQSTVVPSASVVSTAPPVLPVATPAVGATRPIQPAAPATAASASAPEPQHPAMATHHVDASIELEERLGTNWLNKLGALMLVVGIAFFLTYQLRTLGPLGKDIVGLALGAGLLVGGIVAERRTQYQMFSRGVIAGGWGLLFFTTFALYHVPAARVLDSQAVDLVLMLVVAAGMVAHALRYQSQVVTGLAFLFAFGTVAISHDTAFTLSATAILAIASAAIAVRMRWFALEVGAVVGTYVNHFLWLPILLGSNADLAPRRFFLSLGLLVVYWLTFRVSYIMRRAVSHEDERWSTLGAVLNTGGVMFVASQYTVNQDTVFWALIILGGLDALFAQIVRSRRVAFATLVTMGVALIGAAFPFRLGARTVSLAWLVEAEALVVIGMRTRDGLFTRLGVMASAVAGLHVLTADVGPLVTARSGGGPYPGDPAVAAILVAAAAVYYINSLRILPSRREAFPLDVERLLADKLSYAGAAALLGAAWALLPLPWLAPGFMGIALILVLTARRLTSVDLWMQGQGAAFFSVVLLAAVNFEDTAMLGPTHRRIATVLLVATGGHALYWLSRISTIKASQSYGATHAWIGSALLATLAWYEFEPLAVALAWSATGLLMLETGVRWKRRDLRLQAFTALTVAFARLFVVNLNGSGGLLGSAATSTAPLALVFFYVYERIARDESLRERTWLPELMAAFGTVTLGSVLRVALTPPLVAMSWSVLVLLLATTAAVSSRRLFVRQAVLGALAVCGQAVAVNIYGASYFTQWWTTPWFTVGASAALILAALPIARRVKIGGLSGNNIFDIVVSRRPDLVLYFAPLGLIVWLTAVHATAGFITMAWGIEAVLAFLLALWMRERSFRLGALALLLACVLRITIVDVWQMDQQGRYVAFIALGSALLVVSFLYSKYRALLEEYL